jgi:hypothetical protein
VTKSALIYKLRVCACFLESFGSPFFLVFWIFRKFRKNSTPQEKNFFGASKKYAQKEEKKRKRERKGTHTQRINKYDTGFREERR